MAKPTTARNAMKNRATPTARVCLSGTAAGSYARAMRTAVVGHVEWVQFLRVEHMPSPGDILHVTDYWEEPAGGGPGAAVQLAKLAGSCDFFTALGDDELGHRALEALLTRGL